MPGFRKTGISLAERASGKLEEVMDMKALILAGGRGNRLTEFSGLHNKCMLSLGGKALIEYSLDCAVRVDVDEIIIVVGYKAEDIINAYGIDYKGKRVKYVMQHDQRGLVHAVECSQEAIGGDDFMLLLGDEILINPKHQAMIEKFKSEGLFGICGVAWVEDTSRISKTYSIVQDGEQRIYRLIEKARKPLSSWMGTGNSVFRNEILTYIPQTPINQERGEKELPDLIQCAIDEGHVVKSFVICDRYANINSEDDLREAERFLSLVQEECTIRGRR